MNCVWKPGTGRFEQIDQRLGCGADNETGGPFERTTQRVEPRDLAAIVPHLFDAVEVVAAPPARWSCDYEGVGVALPAVCLRRTTHLSERPVVCLVRSKDRAALPAVCPRRATHLSERPVVCLARPKGRAARLAVCPARLKGRAARLAVCPARLKDRAARLAVCPAQLKDRAARLAVCPARLKDRAARLAVCAVRPTERPAWLVVLADRQPRWLRTVSSLRFFWG